ncbi:MAG: hypothetical protein ACI8SE_000422 [Bacteroidia bacterium]|jgi:hypothetical protein
MKSTPNKFIALALVILLCSCSAAKREIDSGLDELVEKDLILHAQRNDLNNSTTREDSVFVVFENEKFKSFYGFNAYMDFETNDSKLVSYGYGKTGKHFMDPVKRFSQYHMYFKHLNYIKLYNRFGGITYSSANLDTIMVQLPIINSDKKYLNYTVIFNDSSQISSIIERSYDKFYYSNDSNVMFIDRLNKPPSKTYFYPKELSKDSIYVTRSVVIDSTEKRALPFESLNSIDSTIHVAGPVYQHTKSVVVYGYISCAPCAVLKSKLKEEAENGKLNDSLIVVVNTFDDIANLQRFIAKKEYKFAYYKTQNVNTNGYAFPKICGYDEAGNLEWAITGYAPSVVKKVVNYLKE